METTAQRLADIEEVWLENAGDVACISNQCGISQGMVYYTMRKYCYKNGKDYQSYLRHPHKPHKPYERHVYKTQKSASLGRIHRKEYILTKTSEEMSEQVSELLKSSSSKDILAGIDLLIRMVEKEICRNGNNIVH